MAQALYAGTGRRKNAVARVRLVPGTGKMQLTKRCRKIHPTRRPSSRYQPTFAVTSSWFMRRTLTL